MTPTFQCDVSFLKTKVAFNIDGYCLFVWLQYNQISSAYGEKNAEGTSHRNHCKPPLLHSCCCVCVQGEPMCPRGSPQLIRNSNMASMVGVGRGLQDVLRSALHYATLCMPHLWFLLDSKCPASFKLAQDHLITLNQMLFSWQ